LYPPWYDFGKKHHGTPCRKKYQLLSGSYNDLLLVYIHVIRPEDFTFSCLFSQADLPTYSQGWRDKSDLPIKKYLDLIFALDLKLEWSQMRIGIQLRKSSFFFFPSR